MGGLVTLMNAQFELGIPVDDCLSEADEFHPPIPKTETNIAGL